MGTVNTASTVPQAPSYSSVIGDYISNYPRLVELQEQYGARDLASQRSAQAEVYPELEKLRGDLIGQVQTGITEQMPDWYSNKYQDYYKSLLGPNVSSGIGADYYSTGMMEQQKNWNDYWRNLAASFSGSQPVYQSQSQTANYTPSMALNYAQGNYGTYMGGYNQAQQLGSQQAMYNSQLPFMYMQGAGNMLSGVGSLMPSTSNFNIRQV